VTPLPPEELYITAVLPTCPRLLGLNQAVFFSSPPQPFLSDVHSSGLFFPGNLDPGPLGGAKSRPDPPLLCGRPFPFSIPPPFLHHMLNPPPLLKFPPSISSTPPFDSHSDALFFSPLPETCIPLRRLPEPPKFFPLPLRLPLLMFAAPFPLPPVAPLSLVLLRWLIDPPETTVNPPYSPPPPSSSASPFFSNRFSVSARLLVLSVVAIAHSLCFPPCPSPPFFFFSGIFLMSCGTQVCFFKL